MLGFSATSSVLLPQISSISRSLPSFSNNYKATPLFLTKTPLQNTRNRRGFGVLSANGNGINKGGPNEKSNNGFNGQEDLKKDQWPIFNISWKDLLNPDPENVVAIGLTGLLTWASVSVLWQLFFITIAILLAALKYSFIAALLIFILITLL